MRMKNSVATDAVVSAFENAMGVQLDPVSLNFGPWFQGQDIYCQGTVGGKCILWLRIGSNGAETIIGYGDPQEAYQQALAVLKELESLATSAIQGFTNPGRGFIDPCALLNQP